MKYTKLDGIIINRRIVGDADRFLTIMTREVGKISVFARSVRSMKSKRASSLDLFSLIRFELVERGERKTLTHVELLDGYREGKKKLGDISRLFAIGELVDALVPEDDPHAIVYDLLEKALTHLSQFAMPEYLYRFKLRLLKELGYENPSSTVDNLDDYIESILSRSLRAKMIQ